MKKVAFFLASMLMTVTMAAQDNQNRIMEGAEFTLGKVNAAGYSHIDFPKKNFIIKRGAIANFNVLVGKKVVVTEVRSMNGKTQLVLKPKDGSKFFRFWPTVTADYEKALEKGELLDPKV